MWFRCTLATRASADRRAGGKTHTSS
jgi:hypothetical protein